MLNVVAVAYQQGNLKARFAKDKQECRSVPLRMFCGGSRATCNGGERDREV